MPSLRQNGTLLGISLLLAPGCGRSNGTGPSPEQIEAAPIGVAWARPSDAMWALRRAGALFVMTDTGPQKHVKEVMAFKETFDDSKIERLRLFPDIERVELSHTAVSDEGLAVLRDLPHLRALSLRGLRFTDGALRHVGALSGLRELLLRDTHVGDAGMECLAALESLEVLSIDGAPISDAGLKPLEPLKRLREIWVARTRATPEGLDWLRRALPHAKIAP